MVKLRGIWASWVLLGALLAGCGGETLLDPEPAGRQQAAPARPPIRGKARIVFFGDSITAGGVYPTGYVTVFERTIQYLNPDMNIDVIGSGVEGDRVTHLLGRLDEDVLSEDPTHVVIYVGVNDVGRPAPAGGNTGVVQYQNGLTELVSRVQSAGAEAIVCTPGVIGEDTVMATGENKLLDRYAQVARQVAAVGGAKVCDLRAAFSGYLIRFNPDRRYEGILTADGIHLNEAGNRFVARQILNTFTNAFEAPSPAAP